MSAIDHDLFMINRFSAKFYSLLNLESQVYTKGKKQQQRIKTKQNKAHKKAKQNKQNNKKYQIKQKRKITTDNNISKKRNTYKV